MLGRWAAFGKWWTIAPRMPVARASTVERDGGVSRSPMSKRVGADDLLEAVAGRRTQGEVVGCGWRAS